MGLDMYLSAKKYIGYGQEELQGKVTEAVESPYGPVKQVEVEAVYWRKANHIHAWFVKNVQDDVDDCGDYEVDRTRLRELLETCQVVLANRSRASELLPTKSGFFFGNTDYDENFFGDVEHTAESLEKLLAVDAKGWYFSYQSSW